MKIRIKNGLDIPLAGAPAQVIDAGHRVRSVAVLGGDYNGLKPRMFVQAGDRVALGQALFHDKHDPDVMYVAPGGGTVVSVNRGPRRVLQSVVIELEENEPDNSDVSHLAVRDPDSLDAQAIRSVLFESGLWTAFRARPYGKVPHSSSHPHSIFVTAIDTQPLAPDPQCVIVAYSDEFRSGLRVMSRLTDGRGPSPAVPLTQTSSGRAQWTIMFVIAIIDHVGRLFLIIDRRSPAAPRVGLKSDDYRTHQAPGIMNDTEAFPTPAGLPEVSDAPDQYGVT